MILLYVSQHGEGKVQVKMRMGNKIWKFALLCNLSDGSFYVGNSECFDHKDWDWITEFSVSMKLGLGLEYLQERYFSMEFYAKSCLRKMQSYLSLSKLWNGHIAFDFETSFGPTDVSDLRSREISLSFSDLFKDSFVQYSSGKGSKYKIDSVFGLLRDSCVKKEAGSEEQWSGDREEAQAGLGGALGTWQQTPSLRPGHIYIYRFSNGMPIICKDAEYCDIVTSVKGFLRRRGPVYGMKLVKREGLGEGQPPEELSLFSGVS